MVAVKELKELGKIVSRKKLVERGEKLKEDKGTVKLKLRKRGPRRKKRGSVSANRQSGIVQKKNEQVINYTQVTEAVRALLLLIEKTADRDDELFGDEPQPILMQVTAARVPKTPSRRLRFKLPHPVITDTSDVCMFVHNFTKKYSKNLDRTVDHYKERFAKEGISRISQVIPFKQIKTEYCQYEEKRRLCHQFDVFLSDVRISDRVARLLGKSLKFSLKTPIPVRVHVDNLKEEIDNALTKTTMQIHGKGDSFVVQVGHTKQSVKAVVQNICTVTSGLSKGFPGGWDNVSALYIKTTNSLSIPVYVSLKSPNDIPVPLVKPTRPKNILPVEGELSTRIGYIAKVFPAGRVDLKKVKKHDSDVEWSDDDWETEWRNFEAKVFSKAAIKRSELEEEELANKAGKKTNKKESNVEVKEEDKVDDDIAEAEDSYLQQWKRKRDDDFEEKKKTFKGEVSEEPKRKKVKYVVGEMCLGNLGNETTKKPKKSHSGGMVNAAFQELKSKISRKKLAKNQKIPVQNKSIICSNKTSEKQKKKKVRGKSKFSK